MRLLGQPATSAGVAAVYRDCIDGIVIDAGDRDQVPGIEALGIAVLCTQTVMHDLDDRLRLARETVAFARSL
jgi:LPPG:FO 2-phospho-L-lactate transferase